MRNLVHDLEFRIVAKLYNTTAYLYFLVGIVEIDYGEQKPWIAAEIAYLEAGLASPDYDVAVAHANPHRSMRVAR